MQTQMWKRTRTPDEIKAAANGYVDPFDVTSMIKSITARKKAGKESLVFDPSRLPSRLPTTVRIGETCGI